MVDDADEFAADLDGIGIHYVSLLKDEPSPELVREVHDQVERAAHDGEHLRVRGRAVHLALAERDSYHRSALSNAWFEKRLGVSTNRNLRVVRAVVGKWC